MKKEGNRISISFFTKRGPKPPLMPKALRGVSAQQTGGFGEVVQSKKEKKARGILWLKDTRKLGQRASHAPLNTCFKGGCPQGRGD